MLWDTGAIKGAASLLLGKRSEELSLRDGQMGQGSSRDRVSPCRGAGPWGLVWDYSVGGEVSPALHSELLGETSLHGPSSVVGGL